MKCKYCIFLIISEKLKIFLYFFKNISKQNFKKLLFLEINFEIKIHNYKIFQFSKNLYTPNETTLHKFKP
jgi:hypothetical protein